MCFQQAPNVGFGGQLDAVTSLQDIATIKGINQAKVLKRRFRYRRTLSIWLLPVNPMLLITNVKLEKE